MAAGVLVLVLAALAVPVPPWVRVRVQPCDGPDAWALADPPEVHLCLGLLEMGEPYLRFALAHELAHLVMSHRVRLDEREGLAQELEADRWAAARVGADAVLAGCHLLHGAWLGSLMESWWLRTRVVALGCPALRVAM